LDSEQLSYFSSKRVLIVDDAKMIRVLMTRILERKGAMCIQAEDGLDAIKCVKDAIARNQIFEVILMDFIMPHMDGPTATSMIRELGYRGLIIGITGNMMPEDVRHFLDHGANTVFPKPIHFEDLDVYLSETAADNKTLRDL
jgi:CheY-like chemotaxis protein